MLNFYSYHLKPIQWAGFLCKNSSQVSNLLWFSMAFLTNRKKQWIFLLCALYTRFSCWGTSSQLLHQKKKKSKIKEGLVKEKKLGILQIRHGRTSGRLKKFWEGENLKKKLLRSRGGKGEGHENSILSRPFPFSPLSPLSALRSLVSPFTTNSLQKEAKRLHETEHRSSCPGLGGIFNENCK